MKPTDYTNPTTQTNQKTTYVHFFEEGEPCFPFSIVEETNLNENGEECKTFEIALGNKKVLETKFETLEETIGYILEKPYSLITSLMCYIVEAHAQFVKEKVELNNLKENEVQQ